MMNRKQRRKTDKLLKGMLSDKQYEDCKSSAIEERVDQEIERFTANFVSVFVPAMRENNISEARALRIIEDISLNANKRFKSGEEGSPRPESKNVEEDEFIKIATKVISSNKEMKPKELAALIYKTVLELEVQQ